MAKNKKEKVPHEIGGLVTSEKDIDTDERERLLSINVRDDLSKIANGLEKFHGLFYVLFEMGEPRLTFKIPTAAVSFDRRTGQNLDFVFNPIAWDRLDPYTKSFVICHECLHVMLNHGYRSKDCPIPELANIALDIVVNHMLVSKFGFNRASLDFSPICKPGTKTKNARGDDTFCCWIDTVFKENAGQVRHKKPFEYYYHLLEKNVKKISGKLMNVKDFTAQKNGKQGESGVGSEVGGNVLDDHSYLEDFDDEKIKEDIAEAINNTLSDEEKEDIDQKINKSEEGNAAKKEKSDSQQAGSIAGSLTYQIESRRFAKKKKWETVIKKWSRRYKSEDSTAEQWARQDRRLMSLNMDFMMPSEYVDDGKANEKVDVCFFQDFSGSCVHLAERFFKAAKSLPSDRFNVKAFCFDTEVHAVDLNKHELHGGGGTSFSVLEKHVQKMLKNNEIKRYPDAIFVITDGYGDNISPEKPENWYWFLSDHSSDYCLPKLSPKYKLSDFE